MLVEPEPVHDAVGRPGAPRAVILVKGDGDLLTLLMDVIQDAGFHATPTTDAGAVLEALDQTATDVVVVVSENRAEIVRLVGRAPVIAIADSNHHWSAEELGVVCLLPLVFDITELEAALHECIEAHRDALAGGT